MQGTQEHDDMAKATDSVMGKRDEKARAGAVVEEGKGETLAAFPPPPGSTAPLVSGSPPPSPGPIRFHLLFCLWP